MPSEDLLRTLENEIWTTAFMKQVLEEGLSIVSRRDTEVNLGDRRQYIGASDAASECERKAYYQKMHPGNYTLGNLVSFFRGHLAEMMFHSAFEAVGIPFRYQLEVSAPLGQGRIPIKIHPDFILFDSIVIEAKSGDIPNQPYSSWIMQNNFQISVLSELENRIYEGYIFANDLGLGNNMIMEVFGPNKPDQRLYHDALDRAERLWLCMQGQMEPQELRAEAGPLCAWCHHREGCPAIDISSYPQLGMEELITEYLEIKAVERDMKNQKEVIKGRVREALVNIGGPAQSAGAVIRMRERAFKTCDFERLQSEFPEAYAACVRTGETQYPEFRTP